MTIPHKEQALALADEATETASAIGAANTLTFNDDGTIHADNTDAPGFLRRAQPLRLRQDRARARRRRHRPRRRSTRSSRRARSRSTLWNRTPDARAGARRRIRRHARRRARPTSSSTCTSVGLRDPSETFKALPLRADELGAGCTVVDMVYRHGGTLLLNTAKANGAEVVDGLEILVAQGAASLERWTGRTAPDQAMREAVADIA